MSSCARLIGIALIASSSKLQHQHQYQRRRMAMQVQRSGRERNPYGTSLTTRSPADDDIVRSLRSRVGGWFLAGFRHNLCEPSRMPPALLYLWVCIHARGRRRS